MDYIGAQSHSWSRQSWCFPHDQPSSNKGGVHSYSRSRSNNAGRTTNHGQDDSKVLPSQPALLEQRKGTELLMVKVILLLPVCVQNPYKIAFDSIIDQGRGPEVTTTAVINLCNQIVSGLNSARHLPKYMDWTAPWERLGTFQSISTGLHRGKDSALSRVYRLDYTVGMACRIAISAPRVGRSCP